MKACDQPTYIFNAINMTSDVSNSPWVIEIGNAAAGAVATYANHKNHPSDFSTSSFPTGLLNGGNTNVSCMFDNFTVHLDVKDISIANDVTEHQLC